jgi:hypothetical protein
MPQGAASVAKQESISPSLANTRSGAGSANALCRGALRVSLEAGLSLIKIGPGVDLQRDILTQMDFAPVVRSEPSTDGFSDRQPEPTGLLRNLLSVPLKQRLLYDPHQNLFFVNFEGLVVKTMEVSEHIRMQMEGAPTPSARKCSLLSIMIISASI